MSDTDPVFHIPIPDWGIPSVLLSLPLSADKTSPYFPMHKEYAAPATTAEERLLPEAFPNAPPGNGMSRSTPGAARSGVTWLFGVNPLPA